MYSIYYTLYYLIYILTTKCLLNEDKYYTEYDYILLNINLFQICIQTILLIFFISKHNYNKNNIIPVLFLKTVSILNVFNNTTNYQLLVMNDAILWLFTSPLIIKTIDNSFLTIFLTTVLHLIHILNLLYQNSIFEIITVMTAIYIVYRLQNHKNYISITMTVIYASIYYLYVFNIISIQTQLLFNNINDIIVKCLYFGYMRYVWLEYENKIEKLSILEHYDYIQQNNKYIIQSFKRKIQISLFNYDTDIISKILSKNGLILDNICVMFIDIVNYTTITNETDCSNVMKLLKNLYIEFDNCINQFKYIQKFETIGDSYMITTNIKKNNYTKNIVKDIVKVLTDMIQCSKHLQNIAHCKDIQIKTGIHIGDVSIGILGISPPRLAIVGNTVNYSNRLETTCDTGKIHVSESICNFIPFIKKHKFHIENRKTYLKNIGTVNTYMLHH